MQLEGMQLDGRPCLRRRRASLSVRYGRQQRDSDENPAHGRAHRTPSPKQGSWRRASPPSIRLPEPHGRLAAVLGYELDAGRFEDRTHPSEVTRPDQTLAALKKPDYPFGEANSIGHVHLR